MSFTSLKRLSVLTCAVSLLGGCATVDTKGPVVEATETLAKGPQHAPFVSITSFSHALRCMDDQMIIYGVRDLSVLVEDLVDKTEKVNAGTKDMLISAVSDMSRRSRAVRLVTFGADSGNLANFLYNAEIKDAYSVVPEYDIRGSISQFDDNVAKKQVDGALTIGRFGIGAASTGGTSILGLDLTVISTRDYSVIPGVTARNQVVIFKEGQGVDAEASLSKLGVNFSLTMTRNEGQAQALRTLVELAAVELFGKLKKVPYWRCLGADPTNQAIKNEIYDWHYSMATHGELVPYMQKQLRLREFYNGPIDGQVNDDFVQAVLDYREALGLSREPSIDLAFFSAYLNADHREVREQVVQRMQQQATVRPVAAQALPTPLQISVNVPGKQGVFRAGEAINLEILTNRDAHVYCYLQDEHAQVQRFYPNRFQADSFVAAGSPLRVPGAMRFQIVANDKGVAERVACFATDADVIAKLAPAIAGTDFENLAEPSLERVRAEFSRVSNGSMAEGYYHVEIR
ncbi:MAG: DUF4384 domain-containing protein [Rhodocyclaceae bacterium]